MKTICGTILVAAVTAVWGLTALPKDLEGTKSVPSVPKTVNGKVELVKAEEVHVRKGAGNFLAKLKAGKPVTVAYLGGSITEMSGWRDMTTDWLRKANPEAEVAEVHAAIGGTGSGLGVFRLGHDALSEKSENPDLLFVEFATNDSGESAESIWRNFDGIVQQTWRKNPKTDIVFVYTITTRMMGEYGSGRMNHAASAMEHLADYYGIPSVCFGPRVAAEVAAGRLVMSLGEVPTAVPKETPDRDRLINEELKKKGQTLFAKDGVHPALPGHEFYLKSVVAAFEAMRELPPCGHAPFVGKPFFDGTLAEAKMVPINGSMLVGDGWTKLAADEPEQKSFEKRGGQFWRADRPGAKLAFRFRGTKCGVYDLLAPKGANVRITVDGKVTRESCPRFDAWCWYTRLAPLWVFDGAEGEHSVEIEVLEEQPDRTLVKKEPTDTPKYDGTWFQPCQIMVVGEVVAANAQCLSDPFLGTKGVPIEVGAPCLQAPGETTMGVSWSVSGLAKGVVEYADNPEMRDPKTARGGGFGLVPIDVNALQVRLTGLKHATKYWYRTVTTPFTDYSNIYDAKLGEPIVSGVHSFMTMGVGAKAHFCAINDTHAQWRPFQMAVRKVKELAPSVVIWNGDATNTTQDKRTAVEIFLNPPVVDRDWSADIPACFESGNHDFRGSWISKKEEVVMPRDPSERRGDQWDLRWNFAVRLGEMALIGLDTGEDKPDAHPKWFGLANFEPYRKAQAKWLEEQFARPEIASAKFKVVFCHIPLFADPASEDYPHDGVKIDPNDFAYWSRECGELWGPILSKAGVKLVVCGHTHQFRFDPSTADRPWAQIVGGGPELGVVRGKPDTGRFPTVIEGFAEDGKLRLVVHDVFSNRVVLNKYL